MKIKLEKVKVIYFEKYKFLNINSYLDTKENTSFDILLYNEENDIFYFSYMNNKLCMDSILKFIESNNLDSLKFLLKLLELNQLKFYYTPRKNILFSFYIRTGIYDEVDIAEISINEYWNCLTSEEKDAILTNCKY